MNIKGMAFLARRSLVIESFGEPAWNAFLERYAQNDPFFRDPVLPVTQIPAPQFLDFNDQVLKEFYGGDSRAYWTTGEKSAEFALTQGQLKGMFPPGAYARFFQFVPVIWKGYFTEGTMQPVTGAGFTDLIVTGVPIRHVYFEFTTLGFAAGGLKALGASRVEYEVLNGFSKGDAEIHYRFRDPA